MHRKSIEIWIRLLRLADAAADALRSPQTVVHKGFAGIGLDRGRQGQAVAVGEGRHAERELKG
ncbi:MAG: hypothetical protein ACO2PN_22065 [Pyrobaculum sp.]